MSQLTELGIVDIDRFASSVELCGIQSAARFGPQVMWRWQRGRGRWGGTDGRKRREGGHGQVGLDPTIARSWSAVLVTRMTALSCFASLQGKVTQA